MSTPRPSTEHSSLRILARLAVGIGLLACGPAHAQTEGEMLAAQVHAIFQAKCLDCHGPDMARPKGDFGYVLDLPRMAANEKMVVRGDPATSELYQLVLNDEMPGDDADVPPLTPAEKETVKRWIELGAPALAAGAAAPVAVPIASERRELPPASRFVRFAGQFHPPSSHFPIALLIAALPAEFMWSRTRKRSWKAVVRFCVVVAAASGVVTAALGWCDAAFSSYTSTSAGILFWHRWLGTGTAVWAVVTALVSEVAHRRNHPRGWRLAFRALLLAGIALVSAAGYFGASLTFGPNHFQW